MILAGDIGGTHTRLAFFENGKPLDIEVFSNAEYASLDEIARKFLAAHRNPVEAAYFGIAGAIRNGVVDAANLHWSINERELRGAFGFDVHLVNDLLVNAHGIAALEESDFVTLQKGDPDPTGNRALISAGTGLGEAGLVFLNGKHVPYATEGGHADFAPGNELEAALLKYLLARFSHVSWERVCSGPGLRNIYSFLRDAEHVEEPGWLAEEIAGSADPSAAIAKNAETCDICAQAIGIFASIYGAEAGNLALHTLATNGLFIGGGIAPKILPHLRGPRFLKAFNEKGRISKLLELVPVRVILNDKTALLGAGRLATLK